MPNVNIGKERDVTQSQRDLYMATLVHDLKNPILAQLSGLNMLSKGTFGQLNPEQTEIVNLLKESVSFLNNMIYSALDVYKYENGRGALKIEMFEIDKLVERCVKELSFSAKEKNIKISYFNNSDIKFLHADETRIRRSITNLLTNAVRYSFPGSEIKITLTENCGNAEISVKNTGMPVPSEIKQHLFEKFSSTSGTGLGLYYCRKTAEAHGGRIYMKNNGVETEFCLLIPLTQNESLKKFSA